MLAQDARCLWIGILEAGMEREIGGQFVPLLCEPDVAVAKVRQRFHEAEVKVGDRFASHTPPKLFAPLPLYEFYEPPSARRRPPWGKDARAPHGVPGALPDPFSQDDEELVLSIPIQGVSDRYAFLSTAARRDADALLRFGFLGYSGRGRLDGRAMFARSVQARLQGQTGIKAQPASTVARAVFPVAQVAIAQLLLKQALHPLQGGALKAEAAHEVSSWVGGITTQRLALLGPSWRTRPSARNVLRW